MDYHSYSYHTCLNKLKSSELGLSFSEADRRLEKYGLNQLAREEKINKFGIFFSQFRNVLIYILLLAGFFSVVLGEYIEAGVIFFAIILNVLIGFIQENKANEAIAKLKQLFEHMAFVIRDGKKMAIKSDLVVLGDILHIEAGNRIPADARLIEVLDLQINESGLTGESMPSKKNIEKVSLGAALADRKNMIFAGTLVVQGHGRAVVTATGRETEMGKIASLVQDTFEEKTPLQFRLDKFGFFLGKVFSLICLAVIVLGLIQERELLEMIKIGIALGVASIPEGLTVAVTFILALGMKRILKKKALTRKLIATETLGSTTVICTDKTGTITEGKMSVSHIVVGEKEFEINSLGSRQDEQEAKTVSLALQTAMMCNEAVIENPSDELDAWRIIGSATEVALLNAATQSGLRKEELLKIEEKINELPFASERKYMYTLHKKTDNDYILYAKGAPEKILDKCSFYYHHGELCPIGDKERSRLNKNYKELTRRGLRVIGLGIKNIQEDDEARFIGDDIHWDDLDNEMTFIAFIALKDPLRPEARQTIKICMEAGIRPIMITGDHRLTAQAIAREAGLHAHDENIITGEELEKVNDKELQSLVKKIEVYARVSPHHKLRIVKALQSNGEVVAMTGDGINDSPALKAADIGISLGTGTDIAKETADIILLDDNFATIVAIVKEGRIIFQNIRKVITYLISDGFAEIVLISGSILFNFPLALLPLQILWINIVNDSLPHFALAFENDDSVMGSKPLKKEEAILNKEMKIIIYGVGMLRNFVIFGIFYYLLQLNLEIEKVRSVIFVILGATSLVGIFSLRSFQKSIWQMNPFSNHYLVLAVLISFVFLFLGVTWSKLQLALGTTALNLNDWSIVAIVCGFNVFFLEAVKFFFIRKNNF